MWKHRSHRQDTCGTTGINDLDRKSTSSGEIGLKKRCEMVARPLQHNPPTSPSQQQPPSRPLLSRNTTAPGTHDTTKRCPQRSHPASRSWGTSPLLPLPLLRASVHPEKAELVHRLLLVGRWKKCLRGQLLEKRYSRQTSLLLLPKHLPAPAPVESSTSTSPPLARLAREHQRHQPHVSTRRSSHLEVVLARP